MILFLVATQDLLKQVFKECEAHNSALKLHQTFISHITQFEEAGNKLVA